MTIWCSGCCTPTVPGLISRSHFPTGWVARSGITADAVRQRVDEHGREMFGPVEIPEGARLIDGPDPILTAGSLGQQGPSGTPLSPVRMTTAPR